MRRFLIDAAILACIGLAVAAAVVSFGLYNPSAAIGHLPGVSWVLHTTYRNAVETWSGTYAKPDLTDLGLVQRGAGHYRSYCENCHSAPGRPDVFVARHMVPSPPHVTLAVSDWNADELFWIVRNGVKMTGMPAWPSRVRDDEVWSVVAFLLRVRDMDAETYRDLALGEGRDVPAELAMVADCARCHGLDGLGRGTGAAPRLDLLGEDYILASLRAYAEGTRPSGIMQPVAHPMSDEQMRFAARHYAGRANPAPPNPQPPRAPDLIEQGRVLATGAARQVPTGTGAGTAVGAATRGPPACVSCHGPWPTARDRLFPDLAGQYEAYLRDQLTLWKSGRRGGTSRAHVMTIVAEHLDDADIAALAAYYASLEPEER